MTQSPTWPPPPNTPKPLSEHDDFLAACIRNWTPKQPILRSQLAGKLCGRTGLKFGSCLAFVNNFCDRHTILVPPHDLAIWSPILVPFVMQMLLLIVNYVLERRHDAAVTHIERVMIIAEKRHLDSLFIYIYAVVIIVTGVFVFFRSKKLLAQAAEARAKMQAKKYE